MCRPETPQLFLCQRENAWLSVKETFYTLDCPKAQHKRENPCLEKEIYNYHALRTNTKEGNSSFRVAKEGPPARRKIFGRPAKKS
jgi:hypothetical protein